MIPQAETGWNADRESDVPSLKMKEFAMSKLAIGFLAAGVAFALTDASAVWAAKRIDRHGSINQARTSYAYAPRHRRHDGGARAINPRDPIQRALDDPYNVWPA